MPSPSADPLDRLAGLVDAGADRLGIEAHAQMVLAVSGGADSIALLHGAARLVATSQRAWRLSVAHLDHRLRPDSADDAAFVVAASASLGLPAEVRRTDVAALAGAEGRSIEEAGREARYRFLEEVAPAGALIATAHTLDDVAETVLINLLRGSGLGGMAGIPAAARPSRAPAPATNGAPSSGLSSTRPASSTGSTRPTPTRPSCATASAPSCCRCSRRSVREPSNASAASAGSPPTRMRCSTSWRPPSWRAARIRPAPSTGGARRPRPWADGSCGWRSAIPHRAPSGSRRSESRRKGGAVA
jgi:tRNA(Ile)-lysidine synthetase-like protein